MKIVVLAGGADQIALISELKSRGHYTVLVDYFDNPPAKRFADKHIVASTLDVEAVTNIVKNEHADMVCTVCTDQALLTVAKVSEELSLPCYISYQTALKVTNKSYMKKVMAENQIPTSKYIVVDAYDDHLIDGFSFPLVVKPVDCNSSKAVTKVVDNQHVKTAVDNAIASSRTNTAIVEEFVEGDEISADFYIEGCRAKFLCATKSNKIRNTKSFTITQSFYPAVDERQEQELTDIAQKIAVAFNLCDCPLLVQLIVNERGFYVLEFSARLGGGSKYKLIEVLSGVNIMKVNVERILGERPTVRPWKRVNFATMNYVYCNNGVFTGLQGIDALIDDGTISAVFQYKTFGNIITKHETSGDRPIGFLVVADDVATLNAKIRKADTNIKILDGNGDDMMIHNLY